MCLDAGRGSNRDILESETCLRWRHVTGNLTGRCRLHRLRHQRRVLGGDLLVVEVHKLREPHGLGEESHPPVHAAQLDIADDVIDGPEHAACWRCACDWPALSRVEGPEPRRKRPHVIVALHELDERVAIEVNCRGAEYAFLVAGFFRWHSRLGAAGRRLVERGCRVGNRQRDDADTIAMPSDEVCCGVIGAERAGEHEPDVALLEHI